MKYDVIFGLIAIGSFVVLAVLTARFCMYVYKSATKGSPSAAEFTGTPMEGAAQILAVQTTGGSVQYGPNPPKYMCQIALSVQLPGRPAYGATVRQLVDSMAIPTLRGATVPAQVDSANTNSVVIDIGRASPPWQTASQRVAPQKAPLAERLQELDGLRATAMLSEAEYQAKREQMIRDF
jgi:hypothetical protein